MNQSFELNRRDFVRWVVTTGAIGALSPQELFAALSDQQSTPTNSVAFRAYQTTRFEGRKTITDIEGQIPREIAGTLYRAAPGQKETFGVKLRHFFDGDAYISGFEFKNGELSVRAKFLDTPERLEEIQAKKMLYHEFGTLAPHHYRGYKKQPSINVIPWQVPTWICKNGRGLLALSDSSAPVLIEEETFRYIGPWDFFGTLPPKMTFTAHPKQDPTDGCWYAFGTHEGLDFELNLVRLNAQTGRAELLHSTPQSGVRFTHDFLMTENYLLVLVPSIGFRTLDLVKSAILKNRSYADMVQYFPEEPMALWVFNKNPSSSNEGPVARYKLEPGVCFHHGNAFEKNGLVYFDSSFLGPSILEMMKGFTHSQKPDPNFKSYFERSVIDPVQNKWISRTIFAESVDFPNFDKRRTGYEANLLYGLYYGNQDDPLLAKGWMKHDFRSGKTRRVSAPSGRAFGEPVFVAHPDKKSEEQGWILVQGYDATRNETFLEITDAQTLDFVARAWAGTHFPLGFHGNFAVTKL